ncbi:MAG TPA: hypothetical protein VJU18_03040, partial [Vicinamibacteria bacterium]|nr:hypothetical protein [Vicinamibacteria bacterium]
MSLFAELLATRGPAALLESTGGAPSLARLSILARHPRALLVAGRDGVRVDTGSGSRSLACDPVSALRLLLREIPAGRWPDEGGLVGALAYDFARPHRPPAATPLLVVMAVDRLEVAESGLAATPPTA